MSGKALAKGKRPDLLGRALDEVNAGLDVGLESLDCFIQQLLLVVVGLGDDVECLFGSIRLTGS